MPWRRAMASTAMKPTLWRLPAKREPGFPSPTRSCMRSAIASRTGGPALPEPRAACCAGWLTSSRRLRKQGRPRDVAEMLGVIDLEPRDVDLEGVWNGIGRAPNVDRMGHDIDSSTALDAGRLVGINDTNR